MLDIKSKNKEFKLHKIRFIFILFTILTHIILSVSIELSNINSKLSKSLDVNLLNSSIFTEELFRYSKNLYSYFIYHGGTPPQISDITHNEIKEFENNLVLNLIKEEKRINNEYYSSVEIEDDLNHKAGLYKEKEETLKNIKEKYTLNEDEIKARILSDKTKNFKAIEETLRSINDFSYYLNFHGNEVNTVLTNMAINENVDITKYLNDNSNTAVYYDIHSYPFDSFDFNDKKISEHFKDYGISGYIIVLYQTENRNSLVSAELARFFENDYLKQAESLKLVLAVISFIAAFLLFYMLYMKKTIKESLAWFYNIYLKQPLTLKIALTVTAVYSLLMLSTIYVYLDLFSFIIILLKAFCFLYIILSFIFILRCILNPKQIFKETEIIFLNKKYSHLSEKILYIRSSNKTLSNIVIFLYIAFSVVSLSFAVLILRISLKGSLYSLLSHIFLLMFIIIVEYLFIRLLMFYGIIEYIIDNMYNEVRDINYLSKDSLFIKPIIKLLATRGKMQETLQSMLKSERLKTDLITNVSHDLRTPLTSIMNYIELCKKPDLGEQERAEYIVILEQKANKLRTLIDDLFEASKLQSGDIKLELITINIVDLAKQSLGELSQKIEEAKIQVKTNFSSEHIYVQADSVKLWRVFENLLTNMAKYSLENTRAYINIYEYNDKVLIEFKNISAYEINTPKDGLFERFSRGDLARTKEGSGLGLSIAKKIVELHKGDIKIDIDGDLFKVDIVLRKKLTYKSEAKNNRRR